MTKKLFEFADLNSNGVKIRTDNSARNPDGGEFYFGHLPELPFKYANARY